MSHLRIQAQSVWWALMFFSYKAQTESVFHWKKVCFSERRDFYLKAAYFMSSEARAHQLIMISVPKWCPDFTQPDKICISIIQPHSAGQ